MKLSPHFTIEEMIKSNTASRKGISNIMDLNMKQNMIALCENILEPIRANYKRVWNKCWIVVTSGYRCRKLNSAIGGSRYSQHMKGEAVDFVVNGRSVYEVWEWIVTKSELDFDQCILEFGRWIHISYKKGGRNRNKITIARKDGKKTVYKNYSKEQILGNDWK